MKTQYRIKTHKTTDWIVESDDVSDCYPILMEAMQECGRAWLVIPAEVKNEP